MIGSSTSSMIKVGAVSTAVVAVVLAFYYVSGLRADLQESISNVDTLKDAVTEQREVVEQMKAEQARIREINSELRDIEKRQEQEIESLKNRFDESSASGEDRDFARLAAQKPGLVESIINNGSAEAARCIELASGAKPSEEEINATTPSQINSLCPSLANPNYRNDR